ncbi:MAG TPA: hypothetical protein VHR66_25700 [Gemmataceae bacterium]|jgi:hypothetical protein|nr:hypothetical protein [Gemmataceae bacterium]
MNSQPYSQTNPPAPAPCGNTPCDVQSFRRTSYYTGKLLTARDFSDEQRYHIDKRRLHNMALHGWGAVCGLKVKPHPHCPALRIIVEAGLAIDDCGREVRLHEDIELLLPQPDAKPKPPNACPPDPTVPPPSPDFGGGIEGEPLWVCLRYCERDEQFSPAPFDECACTGAAQKPNCVSESYCLELSTKEPDSLKKIEENKRCGRDNCADLYKGILDECKPAGGDCIPLAVIRRYIPGQAVDGGMIDNWTHRPLLPSVHRLDRIVRCMLEKMPRHKPTRISDLNWTHGADLRCHEFLHRFIGYDKGFEIKFDGHVRKEGINRRTFQAMIVHNPESPDQPRRMEFAPSHVEILGPAHIRLRIDEHYARRHLDLQNFDLFITLKCDVIVDHHGIPVDGNLLARLDLDGTTYYVDAPTGDGVPGGLFESWIRIHGHERRHETY